MVQEGIAARLGLLPIGTTLITTPSSTNVPCAMYAMRLIFGEGRIVVEGTFIEAPLQQQNIQCLIGRDVLVHGVLVYIGYINQFTFTV